METAETCLCDPPPLQLLYELHFQFCNVWLFSYTFLSLGQDFREQVRRFWDHHPQLAVFFKSTRWRALTGERLKVKSSSIILSTDLYLINRVRQASLTRLACLVGDFYVIVAYSILKSGWFNDTPLNDL